MGAKKPQPAPPEPKPPAPPPPPPKDTVRVDLRRVQLSNIRLFRFIERCHKAGVITDEQRADLEGATVMLPRRVLAVLTGDL